MEYKELSEAPSLYSGGESNPGYLQGQSALDRLRTLSEQRASYNAMMMRKAEDRYNAYMAEMQRRYDQANRKRPWWKKMISGVTGGLLMGGIAGAMKTGNPFGAVIGAGVGAVGGGLMGGLGAGGESGVGGMFPIVTQGAFMGAMAGNRGTGWSPGQGSNVAGMIPPGGSWTEGNISGGYDPAAVFGGYYGTGQETPFGETAGPWIPGGIPSPGRRL